MKKAILFTILLVVSAASFSQQTNPSQPLAHENYLKKSKNQQTVALVLLGSGFVVTVVGFVVASNHIWEDFFTGRESARGTGAAITALALMAGSVPVYIASRKNRRKAFSLSFTNEKRPYLYKNSLTNKFIPSLTLGVNL